MKKTSDKNLLDALEEVQKYISNLENIKHKVSYASVLINA